MPNALVALANITLSGTATTVTFGSIPSTYRDLRIVVSAAVSSEGNLQLRLNGDSGSNYLQINMRAFGGGSAGSSAGTSTSLVSNYSTGLPTSSRALNIYEIFDYSQTDKQKTILLRASHSGELDILSGRWASTAAITNVTILAGSTFTAGSTFSLFGVSS